jgi:hypothetical protein
MAEELLRFAGPVSCEERHAAPQLTLRGMRAGPKPAPAAFAFSAEAPEDLPATLEDVVIASLGDREYSIKSGTREWRIAARAVHLHDDVRTAFYRAVVPRQAPLRRRIFFRLVLTLAASGWGLALLKRLRR